MLWNLTRRNYDNSQRVSQLGAGDRRRKQWSLAAPSATVRRAGRSPVPRAAEARTPSAVSRPWEVSNSGTACYGLRRYACRERGLDPLRAQVMDRAPHALLPPVGACARVVL